METPQPTIAFRPRFLSATFLAVIGLLIGFEALIRVGAVQRALPIRTLYHEPGVVRRMESLQRVIEQYGRVDVLFVGSSVVRCNIRPVLP